MNGNRNSRTRLENSVISIATAGGYCDDAMAVLLTSPMEEKDRFDEASILALKAALILLNEFALSTECDPSGYQELSGSERHLAEWCEQYLRYQRTGSPHPSHPGNGAESPCPEEKQEKDH
jgi:hypothetical protein